MDYKSQLQELIQRDGSGNVEYQILQEKDHHNREFVSRVTLNNVALGLGSGKSKKKQSNKSGAEALKKLKEQYKESPLNEGIPYA